MYILDKDRDSISLPCDPTQCIAVRPFAHYTHRSQSQWTILAIVVLLLTDPRDRTPTVALDWTIRYFEFGSLGTCVGMPHEADHS